MLVFLRDYIINDIIIKKNKANFRIKNDNDNLKSNKQLLIIEKLIIALLEHVVIVNVNFNVNNLCYMFLCEW